MPEGTQPPDEEKPPGDDEEDMGDLAELRRVRARRELEKALEDDDAESDPALQMEEGHDHWLCDATEKAVACWLAATEGNPAIVARLLAWEDAGLVKRLAPKKFREAWECGGEDWWQFYQCDFDAWMTLLLFWSRPAVQRLAQADSFGLLAGWRGGPPEADSVAREVLHAVEAEGPVGDVLGELAWTLHRIAHFYVDLEKEGRRLDQLPREPHEALRAHQAAAQRRLLEIGRDGLTEDAATGELEGWMKRGQAVHDLVEGLKAALPPLPPRVLPETASLEGLCPCGSGQMFRLCCGRRPG